MLKVICIFFLKIINVPKSNGFNFKILHKTLGLFWLHEFGVFHSNKSFQKYMYTIYWTLLYMKLKALLYTLLEKSLQSTCVGLSQCCSEFLWNYCLFHYSSIALKKKIRYWNMHDKSATIRFILFIEYKPNYYYSNVF